MGAATPSPFESATESFAFPLVLGVQSLLTSLTDDTDYDREDARVLLCRSMTAQLICGP